MTVDARTHARLAELVVGLSGVEAAAARTAIDDAVERHGASTDRLLAIADAIITLRNGSAAISDGT